MCPSIKELFIFFMKLGLHCNTVNQLHVEMQHFIFSSILYSDCQNRGYYTSAHVLLNLSNEMRKRDKKGGLQRVLDSIYHMTLALL